MENVKKYMFWFYYLLSILVLIVPIDSRHLSRYSKQAFRRQEPPEGMKDGVPPGISDGIPERRQENPDRPKEAEPQRTTEDLYTDGPIVTAPETDLPPEAIDDALILDYGRYSTINFHYEQKQWMASSSYDRCYDDYTKCYTSLIVPMQVCVMYSTYTIKRYHSYCDAYFENCLRQYRYWRVVGYGTCTVGFFGYPYLED